MTNCIRKDGTRCKHYSDYYNPKGECMKNRRSIMIEYRYDGQDRLIGCGTIQMKGMFIQGA